MVDLHLHIRKRTKNLLERIMRKFSLKSKSAALDAIAQEYQESIYDTKYEHEYFEAHSRDGLKGRH